METNNKIDNFKSKKPTKKNKYHNYPILKLDRNLLDTYNRELIINTNYHNSFSGRSQSLAAPTSELGR